MSESNVPEVFDFTEPGRKLAADDEHKISSLMRLVVLRNAHLGVAEGDEDNGAKVRVDVIAAEFNIGEQNEDGKHQARIMGADETPPTPGGFVDEVRMDTAALVTEYVIRNARGMRDEPSKDDSEGKYFINLLNELGMLPAELIGNALCALMIGTAENLALLPDDEFDAAVGSLRASLEVESEPNENLAAFDPDNQGSTSGAHDYSEGPPL